MSRAHAELQIRAESPATLDALTLADLWNHSATDDMPTSARLISWATDAQPPRSVSVWLASQNGQPVGFAAASHVGDCGVGWVDALAVPARANRAAVRTTLLADAVEWLQAAGCATLQVGGGPRSLMRGALDGSPRADFFVRRGFVAAGSVTDMAADLARYTPPPDATPFAGVVRPPHPRDRDNVDALLAEPSALVNVAMGAKVDAAVLLLVNDMLRSGRFADLMLLWSARGLEGLSVLIFADSAMPIELAYPWSLPRPWAALGPVLLRGDAGAGASALLLDASLRRLHNNGGNSCVAMGVRERALYATYTFKPLRNWTVFVRRV